MHFGTCLFRRWTGMHSSSSPHPFRWSFVLAIGSTKCDEGRRQALPRPVLKTNQLEFDALTIGTVSKTWICLTSNKELTWLCDCLHQRHHIDCTDSCSKGLKLKLSRVLLKTYEDSFHLCEYEHSRGPPNYLKTRDPACNSRGKILTIRTVHCRKSHENRSW